MVVPGFTRSAGAYNRFSGIGGPEQKWFDVNAAAIIPYGLGTAFQSLALVAQGAGPNQRVGRAITIRSIEVKINLNTFWQPGASGVLVQQPNSVSYRVDLILDKQANGALPAAADIYDTAVATVDATCRFPNLYNSDRFVWLKRWEGDINPPSFAAGNPSAGIVSVDRTLKTVKKCNVRMEYSGAVGAVAEIRSNNIFLIYSATTSNAGASQQTSVQSADARIRFTDV